MVDWEDPEVIVYTFFLYEQIAVFLLGFYGTQFLRSLRIEWELITKKRAFKPVVHFPWLLARYVMLSALLFFVITGRSKSRIACDAAYRTFASLGSGAAMLASLTLCTRPVAILWMLKEFISVAVLAVIGLGQCFFVILQGVLTVRARWDSHTSSCEVFRSNSTVLGIFYLYTFLYDVLILAMTIYAVHRVHTEGAAHGRRWRVGDALCVQGIWYVAATCAVNVPVTVLALLNLNAAMNVLLSLPAVTIRHVSSPPHSVIASSLTLFAMDDLDADAKERAARPSGSRASDLVRSGPLQGSLTTHLSMDSAMVDSQIVCDDDIRRNLDLDRDLELDDKSAASVSVSAAASPTTSERDAPV
ncbi:hypothetical protein C8Q79DRAFT_913560 [Trametes meyenii]|nr:hypothetical protein C8Q79DRAFT_913560 [Trametes meyenii]